MRVLPLLAAIFLSGASVHAALQARAVATGFNSPIFVTAPPGDSTRLFVVEQGGVIRIVNLATGTTRGAPFLTISGLATGGEQGLLGLAFHPDYATNGYFYVNVTRASDGATEIRRYRVSRDSNVATPTPTLILTYAQPYANHNGGWLGFGPDGFLYVASGDGGSGYDPNNNAQNKNVLLGKILRIDVENPAGGRAYGIPAGNPFASGGGAPEVWDFGMRNPWRCSFDRATGDLWMGDVGQGAREEIDVHRAGQASGKNYGWRVFEGGFRTSDISDPAPADTVEPVYQYTHAVGQAITGGYVMRGPNAGDLAGYYVFGDYVAGRVWTFRPVNGAATSLTERTAEVTAAGGISQLSSFGEDAAGNVYAVSLAGTIYRLQGGPLPRLKVTSSHKFTTAHTRVRLLGTASGTTPIARVVVRRGGSSRSVTATGTRKWRVSVALNRGLNRFLVQAIDTKGLRSRTVIVAVSRR